MRNLKWHLQPVWGDGGLVGEKAREREEEVL